ncbi:MAG: hypothetical protein KDC35_17775 [Acidobacteria bacterium]|nr:hypothetical protein [Acidobacteriota bacterium]
MGSEQFRPLLGLLKQAARDAGKRILEHYGGDYQVFNKGIGTRTGDVVTQADHDAQDIIFNHLDAPHHSQLMADIAVLAEEMTDHAVSERFTKPYTLLIDPMDGTRGFMDHNNSFGVSIGLIKKDGTPVLGVVFLPALDQFLVGIHQQETQVNGVQVRCDRSPESNLTLWLSEAEFFPAERNAVWHLLCRDLKNATAVKKIAPVVVGSPVHKGCNLVTHDGPSLYVGLPRREKGVSLWDMGAIASIVTGAGGWVSDIYGNPLELNRADSTFVHHRGFVFATHPNHGEAIVASFKTHCGDRLF